MLFFMLIPILHDVFCPFFSPLFFIYLSACPCVFGSVSLPEEPPSAPPQNVIASGRTNQSIMIQWQPPQESHQNGILRGYIIR